MFRLITFCLVCFAPSVLLAQTFGPGYVVVEGDTLRGEVALGTERENARGVVFRASAEAESTRYAPVSAEAFGEDGGRAYRRGSFQLAFTPDDQYPDGRLLFARVVREGAATLLSVEVVEGRAVFFLQAGGETTGLYIAQDEVRSRRGVRQRERPIYKQALLAKLDRACVREGQVRDVPYTEAGLAELVDAYNACVDPAYVALREVSVRKRTAVTFTGGVTASAVQFRRAQGASRDPVDDPTSTSLGIAALAVIQSAWMPPYVEFEVGAEYERGVVRASSPTNLNAVERFDLVRARLGARLALKPGQARLGLGLGLLAGPVRTVETGDAPDTRDDLVPLLSRREMKSNIGQYVEVTVGHVAVPVQAVVRAQSSVFVRSLVQPQFAGSYGTRAVSAGLRLSL